MSKTAGSRKPPVRTRRAPRIAASEPGGQVGQRSDGGDPIVRRLGDQDLLFELEERVDPFPGVMEDRRQADG